jgi:hypothetical protein
MTSNKRRHWVKSGTAAMTALSVFGVVAADPLPAPAPAGRPSTVEELLQRLERRDTLITDLQRRVKELDRQVASMAVAQAPTMSEQPPAASPVPSAPPVAPEAGSEVPPQQAPAAQGAAAPGQFEVDEEAAERALERTLVAGGALLLSFGQAEIQPGFAYTRAEEDAPVFFLQEGRQSLALQRRRSDVLIGDLLLRLGLPFDSQLELDVPYRYVDREDVIEVGFGPRAAASNEGSGFGDVRVGVAKGLLRERRWWQNLIGRVVWDTDSGETDDGISFGSGFHELQGSLVATKRRDPLVFIGSLSYATTFEKDDIEPGDQLGFSVGALLAASPETSLRAVLNQTFADEAEVGGRAIDGTDEVVGILTLGASSIIGRGKLLDLTAGIGLTDEAPDYSVGISLSVRFDVPVPRF